MSETVRRCAACRAEKPVSQMKTCMHNQMHNYVCDSKCMDDFYNPPKKPSEVQTLKARLAESEREHQETLLDWGQVRLELAEAKRRVVELEAYVQKQDDDYAILSLEAGQKMSELEAELEARQGERAPAVAGLVEAASKVLKDLNARIDCASARGARVPVFRGIADLHEALAAFEQGVE